VEIKAARENLGEAIRATRELVANREVPALFEATFEHGGVLVRVDILQRRDRKRWRLLEVKSTADLKDYHLYDVAIQSRVLSRCKVQLSSSALMHLNRTMCSKAARTIPAISFGSET
jgi:predicted RecB family nuclease